MKKLLINMKENEKGFTLIELIVVIAIIGILAAVLLPKFSGFTDKAREKAIISEAKNVYTAYSACQAEISTVVSTDIEKYLGKLPDGVVSGGITVTAADPTKLIVYTAKAGGKEYNVNITDGGDITAPPKK